VASLEVKVGKLSEKKEMEKRVCGDSGDMGRPREHKTGAGCTGSTRTTKNTCKSVTGDNGCGALSWKRESARLASSGLLKVGPGTCAGSGK